MPRLIDRYVLREVVPPFLIGLVLVVFVLLMNQVLLLAELFIDKGVPVFEAVRILGLLVPSILVFALPMAVLMGVLGGLARLSSDSEIIALQAVGIGPRRLGRPILAFGLCGALLTLPLALVVAPRANSAWVQAMTRSVLGRVQLKVEPLVFNEALPNIVFFVREAGRDDRWRDVFAHMTDDPANPRVVLARSGTIRLFPERRRAILELVDGVVYSGPPNAPEKDTLTAFERLEEEIDVESLFPAISSAKRVREKDIGELTRDLAALETAASGPRDDREIRAHRIEIHKKIALPAACFVLALLGLPLGLMTGRAGRTGGFSLGLVIILLYYVLLTAGESAAMDGRLSAVLGMWGPDILLSAAGALLYAMPGRRWLILRRRARGPSPAPARTEAPAVPAPSAASSSSSSSPSALRPRPIRFPGLLDRYIARKFLALLALLLAGLAASAFILAFFERLGETLSRAKPVGLLARHVWFRLPELLAFLLPVAVLTAALLALGFLARTNESTAMKTCGISAYRMALPVLALTAAACALAFAVQERVVPAAHARSEAAWSAINDLPPRSYSFLNRHWVLGRSGDTIYRYDYLDPASGTFSRLAVFDIAAGRWALARRFFAEKATFEGDALSFRDGWTRDFEPAEGPSFVRSESGRVGLADGKEAFLKPWKEPLQMTLAELGQYTAEVRGMGFPADRLRAALAQKTAMPFVSLIMALLAVPFGSWMGRKGTLVGVGLSVVVAMAYWGAFSVFRSLGVAGVLTPFLGAWGANILFGLAGSIGLFRLRT
ncbi:MAG: permease YjgP/YjgQ family protein [Candidatus Aminicenantes bacterium]|nr:permease YjgP/YjgQ family protein [Candidatus Aminicenantes bacterium]